MATQAQVDELLEKMGLERSRFLDAVSHLTGEQAQAVPLDAQGEEQWSPLEQIAHLWEMEQNYDAYVEACLAADNPDVGAILMPVPPITLEEAHQHRVDELVDGLKAERAQTLDLIGRLALSDFDRVGTHPLFGTLSVLQWLRSFYRHDRQHAAQIEGRVSEYRPRFQGPEPNQRSLRRRRAGTQRGGGSTMNDLLAAAAEDPATP